MSKVKTAKRVLSKELNKDKDGAKKLRAAIKSGGGRFSHKGKRYVLKPIGTR